MDITCNIGHTFTISYMLPRAIHLPITLRSYFIRTSLKPGSGALSRGLWGHGQCILQTNRTLVGKNIRTLYDSVKVCLVTPDNTGLQIRSGSIYLENQGL